MSLPKPYYEHAGITIYHGANRVNLPCETRSKERIQAIAPTYREEEKVRRIKPQLAWRQHSGQVWEIKGIKEIQPPTLRKMRRNKSGAAPHRWEYCKQRRFKHSLSMPKVSHVGGWTV